MSEQVKPVKVECPDVIYASKEEAVAAWTPPPPRAGSKKAEQGLPTYQVYSVADDKGDVVGYVWGMGYVDAGYRVLRTEFKWTVALSNGHSRSKPVTQDAAMAFLSALTLEQRQAMGVVIPGDPPLPKKPSPKK